MAAEDRIAVMPIAMGRITAVHRNVPQYRTQEIRLPVFGPMAKSALPKLMQALDLLQENQFSPHLSQRSRQLVDHQVTVQRGQPLMDVVRNDLEWAGHHFCLLAIGNCTKKLLCLE